ncbi:MAG: protein-methionine-sulfoxide reductase catalytic subunit MsrP [Deltaproteobacteria bacterium]|nr:MAG: protein-methionine-sulfoxide reductase catalytic subunit MsrP [Deltaproteobacteria bacterium]
MAFFHRKKPWAVAGLPTDEAVYRSRREIVKALLAAGLLPSAVLSSACRASRKAPAKAGPPWPKVVLERHPKRFPAPRAPKYADAGRPMTPERLATSYNNFYEFSTDKERVRDRVGAFRPYPWTVEVTGLVERPLKLDLDDLYTKFEQEERVYRFRCVEAWSMTVPWTGFPLRRLLERARPLAKARFVRFISAADEETMPGVRTQRWYPWPYFEGLRLDEAMHDLTLCVTGLYGKPLPKQNGAPVRIVVPWKYGYKSPKSVVRIELVETQPKTFWETLQPSEYPFESNVDPRVPHPRWSQATERLLDTGERIPTQPYNGYTEVASLYRKG